MEMIATVAAAASAEALKAWGVFALLLIGLGTAYLLSERRSKAKDEEIKALRADISRLQDLRLQDAREIIRIAETGTTTMTARAAGDADFRDLMRQLVFLMTTQGRDLPRPQLLPPGNP